VKLKKINSDLTQKNQAVIEGYKRVTALFAEPPSTKSEDYFSQLSAFLTGIEQAHIANNKRKAEEAAALKKSLQNKTTVAKPNPTPQTNSRADQPLAKDAGAFDSLLMSYKTGAFIN